MLVERDVLGGAKDDKVTFGEVLLIGGDQPQVEQYRKHWDSSLELLEGVIKDDSAELAKLKQVAYAGRDAGLATRDRRCASDGVTGPDASSGAKADR